MPFGAKRLIQANRERAESLVVSNELSDYHAVALAVAEGEQSAHLIGARRTMSRRREALESTRGERPEHALLSLERDTCRFDDQRQLFILRTASGEARSNSRDAR